MPSVLLIRPLCEGGEIEFAEPLGIERLAGYLQAHGVDDVAVFDRRLYRIEHRSGVAPGDAPGFFDELRAVYPENTGGPSVVGLSLMTATDLPDARRIVSRLRAWWPQAAFVAGGVYATTAPSAVERGLPRGVAVLRGEGEAQLLAIVRGATDAVGAGTDGEGPRFVSPDEWAVPYRPHLERYAALRCAVNLQGSRGCPGACTFCATPQLPHELRHWRPRDLRLVVDEMQQAADRLAAAGRLPVFNFVDDDFGPIERVEALAEELHRRDMRVAFALEMRAASLIGMPALGERLTRLYAAGLTRVFVGVESLAPATLARWHKRYDVAGLPQVLQAFREAGVALQPGYILWHADQTVEGARHEVERLHRLGIYSHRAALSRLIVFEGCALEKAGRRVDANGFQAMCGDAEKLYRRFSQETAELTQVWTEAAVAEPYAAAEAWLTGDCSRLQSLRRTIDEVNAKSFGLFEEMSA